jgi:hypothetical protein
LKSYGQDVEEEDVDIKRTALSVVAARLSQEVDGSGWINFFPVEAEGKAETCS